MKTPKRLALQKFFEPSECLDLENEFASKLV